jgi:hypothetical protein
VNEQNRIYLEHTLAKAIHIAIAAGERWTLPPARPVIEGFLGTYAIKYKNRFFIGLANDFFYSIIKKAIAR